MNTERIHSGIERSDWAVIAVVLALAIFAAIDSQYAFLVAFFGIPSALIWLIRIGVVHRQRPRAVKALGVLGALLLLFVGPASCAIQTRMLEARLEPVIFALETYRLAHGQYPKKLSELNPAVNARCSPSSPRQAHYSATNGDTEFLLMCVNFGMNKHTYSSATQKWRGRD